MVHPAIANLLADPSREALGQVRPPRERLLVRVGDHVHDNGVFVIGPLTLADTWLEVSDPALVALLGTVDGRV